MPKLNGLDAAQNIRQGSLNKTTPIVVISANTTNINQQHLHLAGINVCLQKPIDEKEFFTHILTLLNQFRGAPINWNQCIKKVSGNHALAEEFLEKFVEELQINKIEFLQFYENTDLEGLLAALHKLHGACCFCGVPYLEQHVTELEKQALKAKNMEELSQYFKELIKSIDEVINEFNLVFKKKVLVN
jgi:two-component system sensor histidine kinase BarA